MKKVLLAGAAIATIGSIGAAQAADPISLKLGGYSKWVLGFSDFDNVADRQSPDVHTDTEVFFLGATTLDNGLKIGIKVELEADRSASSGQNTIDETFVTIDGGFGRVVVGNEDNMAYLMHVGSPDAAGLAEDNPMAMKNFAPINPSRGLGGAAYNLRSGTSINFDSDDQKVSYVTPNWGGFSAGVSYTPSVGSENQAANAALGSLNPGMHVRGFQGDGFDDVSLAASYNRSFDQFRIKASAGFLALLDDLTLNADHHEFSFGAQIGFGGFTVGGAAKFIESDIFGDIQNWSAGVQYASGPYSISLVTFNTDLSGVDDDFTDVHVSGRYAMGPGVDAIASLGYFDRESGAGAGGDGWAGVVGLSLAF